MKLEMTPSQAWILKRLLENVGGNPKGPRGEMDKLLWKLESRCPIGPTIVFSNDHQTGEPGGPLGIDMNW